jgi:hypothetical protein
MKVKQLIELLAQLDAEAVVVIMEQPHYPMEHRVAGVTSREDCHRESDQRYEVGGSPNDVILVDGAWLRYGCQEAWHAAHRRRG